MEMSGAPSSRLTAAAVLVTLGLALSACVSTPKVARHPAPAFYFDLSVFEELECEPRGRGGFDCGPETPPGKIGCDRISASPTLGGLEPSDPIAHCFIVTRQNEAPPRPYVRGPVGVFFPTYTRFLIVTSNGLEVIESIETFRARYAPILSPEEALSFALAVTGYEPFRGFEAHRELRYFEDRLEETHVEARGEDFVVRSLRRDRVFGCGPHPTFLVDVLVTRDGQTRELRSLRAFEDPRDDDLCVD